MRAVVTRSGISMPCEVRGNVVWLIMPPADQSSRANRCLALKLSVTQLSRELERSQELRSEIAAAIATRRYELYKMPGTSDARAANRALATAQRIHLGSLLRFVHSVAAAQTDIRARAAVPASRVDALTRSIESLKESVKRAQALTRELLQQCRHQDRC